MNILHLDSSIQGDASASRTISAAVVAHLRAVQPDAQVRYRDLAASPLDHLTLAALGEAQAAEMLDDFLGSDTVVIGAPLYNFTIPSQLKSWTDRILIAGKTFRYAADGPEGLVGGKRVIVALSRGAVYGEGSPFARFEHAERCSGACLRSSASPMRSSSSPKDSLLVRKAGEPRSRRR